VTTTRRGTIIAPTRREVLMSLGALAIGIGAGPLDRFPTPPGQSGRSKGAGGQGYLVAETYPRPADWHERRIEALVHGCSIIAAPALRVPTRHAKRRIAGQSAILQVVRFPRLNRPSSWPASS
jgi:hypothetical protein